MKRLHISNMCFVTSKKNSIQHFLSLRERLFKDVQKERKQIQIWKNAT